MSVQYDQDYYPGRRKRGKDYKEGMVRLMFFVLHQFGFKGFLKSICI